MQYGEDTDDDLLADVYRDADDVVNWGSVMSVSMAVLMRSPEDGLDESGGQTWDLLGTVAGPFADRRPTNPVHHHGRRAQSRRCPDPPY